MTESNGTTPQQQQPHRQPYRETLIAFPRRLRRGGRLTRIFILFLAVLFFVSMAAGGVFWFIRGLYLTLPTFGQLQNIEPSLVSKVLGCDGTVIHEFSIERRFWISLDSMPKNVVNAVVATEDRRFFDHWGIDVRRIFGAVVVDILHGGYKQGASTITQQLARNVYLTARQSLVRKVREALTAVQLERYYTKNQILELYLNQVYLGAGVYGVQAASQKYFSKNVWQLNLNECAVIAGTIQLPEYYRPDKDGNLKRAQVRRNSVLTAMYGMGYIDRRAYDSTQRLDVPRNPQKFTAARGPYFIEMVRQWALNKYGDDMLYNGGLTIKTTIDPTGQAAAETAMHEQLADLQGRCNRIFLDMSRANYKLHIPRDTFLNHFDSIYAAHKEEFAQLPDSAKWRVVQVALVALDARTGEIRTLVGGRNFDESKFNRMMQGYRQPGSAFKPIVYCAAIDRRSMTSMTTILDQPITLQTPEGEWRPENYDNKFYGRIPMRKALALSVNLPAIQTLLRVGADTVVQYARLLGLTTPIAAVPSIAIGSCDVAPIELVTAYDAFANGGYLVKPYFIDEVYDKAGRLLDENKPQTRRALSPQTAYIMADMLGDVICCGTGAAIPGLGFTRPAGGKTGTTNRYSDAWFIGFTPQIVCGVWVGTDEQRSLGGGVTGSFAAIPIWVKTMTALHRNLPVENFFKPDSIVTETVCKESGKIASRYCPPAKTRECYLIEGTLSDTCDIHGPRGGHGGQDIHRMFGTGVKREDGKKTKRNVF